MNISLDRIADTLSYLVPGSSKIDATLTRASVAMILHQTTNNLEILFIERAPHKEDPWSGHIAFPGGKLEKGETEYDAACRESFEEIGVDLKEAAYLGRLCDIAGSNLPVRVSCCLFVVEKIKFYPKINEEVSDLFWISVSELNDSERHIRSMVSFGEKYFEVPAIKFAFEGKPVLWGITYRLVMQFLSLLKDIESDRVCE
ncbi:MAG: CoA pyrophosphatase [Desulfuromonadaceae bacterium]|nr:CoA pyrophosphatase [Desulfuromonadaceae bacterium]MDD2856535.1 CoA pyrophosphatase [Desulfuromonadaceae bacterium]